MSKSEPEVIQNNNFIVNYLLPTLSLSISNVCFEVRSPVRCLGSIPAGGPIVDEFFSTVPWLEFRHVYNISTRC